MFDAWTKNSKCARCKGFYHGVDHVVGTNPCCLAGISHDPERDFTHNINFPPSTKMLAIAASGRILRGSRSLHQPFSKQLPRVEPHRFKTAPRPTEYFPIVDVKDPFQPPSIIPYPKLQLDGDTFLRKQVSATSKTQPVPRFDEWLPAEERLALRRFKTVRASHSLDRNVPQSASGQWWENNQGDSNDDSSEEEDHLSTNSDSDSDSEGEGESGSEGSCDHMHKHRGGQQSSWMLRGKKMHKIEADQVTLSPLERFLGNTHNSGGGIRLSSAHRWLRHAASMIIALDAGKTGMRNVNALEYALRKYDHALRCKSYAQAAKHWHDEYTALTQQLNWKFYNDHLKRRSIDARRQAKEIGLENALRGGGFDFGTGLGTGEKELLHSGFSANVIHDLEWSGDTVKNLDIVESVQQHTGSVAGAATGVPGVPGVLNVTESITQVDPYLKALGQQRDTLSATRSQYWDLLGVLDRDRGEARMVIGALYQAYTTTEFLEVLERRPAILTKCLCSNNDDSTDNTRTKNKNKNTIPHIEALGGVAKLQSTDLLVCQRLTKIPRWTVDLLLCLGVVLGTIDITEPSLQILFSKGGANKKQRTLNTTLAAKVHRLFFGEPSELKSKKCWKFLQSAKATRAAAKDKVQQYKQDQCDIMSNIRRQLKGTTLKSFDRSSPKLVTLLLERHRTTCQGQPSMDRWKVPKKRSPLDRVVEGLCVWLEEVSAYYRAALPFWSTLNAIAPLESRMQEIEQRIENETKALKLLSVKVDEELSCLRKVSAVYASKHVEKQNRGGMELRWRRKLPGQIGSEKFYPEKAIRDGNYRFPLPLEYGEPFRSDLRRRMNKWYVQQSAPWFSSNVAGFYGNPNHPDHPERTFAHKRQEEQEALKEKERAAHRHEHRVTKRMLKLATDEHLDEILKDGDKLHHHVHHHHKNIQHEDLANSTIWKWTWTHRKLPLSGHTRTEILSASVLPSLPLIPVAPN